jgi:HEAT repeat protein
MHGQDAHATIRKRISTFLIVPGGARGYNNDMQDSLPLKLGISILVVFGLLLAGMALYMPFWYRYQLRQLRSDHAGERGAAAEAIAARGKGAMPYIKEWLRSGGDKTAAGACLVLEKMDGSAWKDALEELEKILDHARSEKTDAVAMLFLKKKYGVVLKQYEMYFSSYKYDNKFTFYKYDNKSLRKKNILLCFLYKAEKEAFRSAAIYTLSAEYKDATDIFYHTNTVFREDKSGKVRATAADVLGEIGDKRAVETLINALKNDSDSEVRKRAVIALGEIRAAEVVEHLIISLKKDPDSKVRYAALSTLLKISKSDTSKLLIYALKNDSNYDVREFAVRKLGEIGGKKIIELIIWVLKNDINGNVRARAASSLGKINDSQSVSPLISAIKNDSYYRVRLWAANALVKISKDNALEPMIYALKNDSYQEVRKLAARTLIGTEDKSTVKPLINALLKDSNADVRMYAATALGRIGDVSAVEPLIFTLQNSSVCYVRSVTARALGRIGDSRAVESLISSLINDTSTRSCAADALGALGNNRAVEPLIEILKKDIGPYVITDKISARICAACALGAIGNNSAIETLISTMKKDSVNNVRNCAAIALAGFENESIDKELIEEFRKRKKAASIALSWRKGGSYIKVARSGGTYQIYLKVFLADAMARWGDLRAVNTIIMKYLADLYAERYHFDRFHADVFSRMPEGFPVYDFKANYATRKKQAAALKEWYQKHKDRLVWNEKGRRYFIRP